MATQLPLELATFSLADLARMLGCSDRAVRRKLRKQSIEPDGHRVQLAALQANWPLLFNSILILNEPRIRCPRCAAPTQRACTCCDYIHD